MSNITTSNWYAWVNLMPPLPAPGGRLHLTGTVDTHSIAFAYLHKRNPQGINPKILILDLYVFEGIVPAKNPQMVPFAEHLQDKDQYQKIEIYYDNKLEAKIEKIDEVH